MGRQTGLMRKQAKIAAAQHELNRAAFVATHRGRLVVRRVRIERMIVGHPLVIEIEIANKGATTAHLGGIAIFSPLLEDIGALEFPPVRFQIGPISEGMIDIAGGASILRRHETDWTVSAEETEAVERGWRRLHVIGCIRYMDDNAVRSETGFFRYFDPGPARRFRKVNDPDYEYED
jgi:hypothetical protein